MSSKRYRKNSANFLTVILRGSICFDRHQEQTIDLFESYIAPVDCLTAPEMRLVAFSEKPLCLIDVLTATMRADGVSPGLDEAFPLELIQKVPFQGKTKRFCTR